MDIQDLKKLQQKVTLLRAEGKYKETIEESHMLLSLGKEFNDYKSMLTAHINNAASFYSIGAMEDAFQSIEAYEEICSKYGDEADTLNLYNVLFLLYEYNKEYGKAKETLTKTIKLGKKIEKYNIISNAHSNYSHVSILEADFEEALEMSLAGLEMAKLHKPKSRILEVRVTLNIAQSYIGLGNLEEAKNIIDEIIQDPILDSFIREKTQSYMLQGNWFAKQELYREAFGSLTRAKELVESYNDIYLLKTIQEERSKLCEQMNNIPLGYQVQKEYISLLNEINNRELALTALKLDIKHSLSAMKKKASTDYLTGLFNRDYLETTTDDWLKQASKTGEGITCIVFDIDSFKSINDEYGHLFGDEVIKHVSKTCSSIMIDDDIIGRYGGDEFVVVLRDSLVEKGKLKAEQIQDSVRSMQISKNGKVIPLSLSIGVADNSGGKAMRFHDLFHAADEGLYKAKKNGKNQVIISQ
ncbi:tetratricopeptide repeat-containing diguanylate cyclase [Paucisalibacillus globulus]|uniref:tetratricopeptide repeat-containing diguanylate cyclase n=1 Tax=Paucisalibacillus globulus TaxID=351095 RepID=UPI00041BCF6A|nr:GGDEF domain-containing protein [Paucisalibacillus globulus]